jgi:hypothetical protein
MADTGRPPKYETPEQLQIAIDNYFSLCDSRTKTFKTINEDGHDVVQEIECPEEYTITGLALSLGFCDKRSLYDYEEKEEFTHPIKRAKLRIENQVEKEVRSNKNAAGPIFILKNFGWRDKTEVDHTGTFQVTRLELPAKVPVGDPLAL